MTVHKGQVFILFLFVGVLVGLMWSFTSKSTKDKFHENNDFTTLAPTMRPFPKTLVSLDERVIGVAQAWDDTMWSPLTNRKDLNSMYNLWYSNMVKQGLSNDYINPKIFEQLYELSQKDEWTREGVAKIISPAYELEKTRYIDIMQATAARKITKPLCTQY